MFSVRDGVKWKAHRKRSESKKEKQSKGPTTVEVEIVEVDESQITPSKIEKKLKKKKKKSDDKKRIVSLKLPKRKKDGETMKKSKKKKPKSCNDALIENEPKEEKKKNGTFSRSKLKRATSGRSIAKTLPSESPDTIERVSLAQSAGVAKSHKRNKSEGTISLATSSSEEEGPSVDESKLIVPPPLETLPIDSIPPPIATLVSPRTDLTDKKITPQPPSPLLKPFKVQSGSAINFSTPDRSSTIENAKRRAEYILNRHDLSSSDSTGSVTIADTILQAMASHSDSALPSFNPKTPSPQKFVLHPNSSPANGTPDLHRQTSALVPRMNFDGYNSEEATQARLAFKGNLNAYLSRPPSFPGKNSSYSSPGDVLPEEGQARPRSHSYGSQIQFRDSPRVPSPLGTRKQTIDGSPISYDLRKSNPLISPPEKKNHNGFSIMCPLERSLTFEEDKETGMKIIASGSINDLIRMIAPKEAVQQNYVNCILLTKKYFISSEELIDKLIQMYCERPSESAGESAWKEFNKWQKGIQGRIINFLNRWIELYWSVDWINNDNLLGILIDFICTLEKETPFVKKLKMNFINKLKEYCSTSYVMCTGNPFSAKIDQFLASNTNLEGADYVSVADILTTKLPDLDTWEKDGSSPSRKGFHLSKVSPVDLATQLTLRELVYFTKISPSELLFVNWKKKNKEELAPNIVNMITWFNKICYWVATEIVKIEDLHSRRNMISLFIKTAKECHELKNYNATQEIISTLNRSVLQRLKVTWSGISKTDLETFHTLTDLMSHNKNSIKYREEFKSTHPPHIPYIGVHLQDLLAIEELPTKLDNGKINFKKLHKIEVASRPILDCLRQNYGIKPILYIQKMLSQSITVFNDDDLYKYSNKCEPSSNSHT